MPARDLPAWLAADANRSRGEFVARPARAAGDGARSAAGAECTTALLVPLLADLAVEAGRRAGRRDRRRAAQRALRPRARAQGQRPDSGRRRRGLSAGGAQQAITASARPGASCFCGVDVLARAVLHAVQLAALLGGDLAVGLGVRFDGGDAGLLLVEAVGLARVELAGGDAGVDALLLLGLALVDARRGGQPRLGRTRRSRRSASVTPAGEVVSLFMVAVLMTGR